MDKLEEYNYWLDKKYSYERNLHWGVGDSKSINFLINKINIKLNKLKEYIYLINEDDWVIIPDINKQKED